MGKLKSNNLIKELSVDGISISNPTDICSAFNSYFVNIGNKLANDIPPSNIDFKYYCKLNNLDSFFCVPSYPEEICIIVNSFKNGKSPGYDNLGTKIIKYIINLIAPVLSHIFNLSLQTGIFPQALKIAKVIPIYKKGPRNIPGNYRPISLLSVMSKILERLMYNRLYDFFNKHNFFYKYQFGFRKFHSTSLALIELVDSLRTNSDDGKFSLGIFIDLQKAFDTVDHEILLFKLSSYGIRGLALDWFRSYLTSRSQFVSACNARSSTLGLTCGVPQGSILGPLLFIIYINDIQSAVSKGTTKLFADDTNIFLTGKALDTVFVDANLVLNELNSWFSANKLSLSPEKTCYCLFSNHFIEIPTNLNLYLNGNPVPRVSNCKYLGVLLDSRLSWKYHIESVEHKLLKFVPIFYKLN